MKNSAAANGTTISALVAEGKALGKMWNTINNVKQTTKANGFDTRLGKLLSELKAQSTVDSGQIATHVLRTYGIQQIDRRRRSEALWFVENEVDCRKFIADGKFKGSSLTALQAAMRKADKASEPKADTHTEPKAEAESNVGLNSEAEQSPFAEKSASDIALDALVQCEVNGITVKDFMLALKEQLEMLDKVAA